MDSTEKWEDCDVFILGNYTLIDKWDTALSKNKNLPFAPLFNLDKSKIEVAIFKDRKIYLFVQLHKASEKWIVSGTGVVFKPGVDVLSDLIFNKNKQIHILLKKHYNREYFWVEDGEVMVFRLLDKKIYNLRDALLTGIKAKNERADSRYTQDVKDY